MMGRILYAIRRRPVRLVEALVGLAIALGLLVGDPDEITTAILILTGALGVGGGEVVQRGTTPLHDPRDADGRSLVPSDDPHAAHHYEDG